MGHLHVSQVLLSNSLQDPEVVNFVKNNILLSYKENFKNHTDEVDGMIKEAFARLAQCQNNGTNFANLENTVSDLTKNLFRATDKNFWFYQEYQKYKVNTRPLKDLNKIESQIHGKHILDFGSGGGYLALALSKRGYDVTTTDVLDYRIGDALKLPFTLMNMPDKLPDYNKNYDTVIAKTVFHHIDSPFIVKIISGLSKITHRLIIEEDTYDIPMELEGVQDAYRTQEQLQAFVALEKQKQKKALVLLDFFANNIALGIPDINCPFEFKTVSEWKSTLDECGFNLTNVIFSGFESGKMHRNCQVWMMCDRKE